LAFSSLFQHAFNDRSDIELDFHAEDNIKGNAHERGVSQGQQLKDRVKAAKQGVFYSQIFKEMKPKLVPVPVAIWGLSRMGKNRTKEYIEKHVPRQLEKMRGIAEGARRSSTSSTDALRRDHGRQPEDLVLEAPRPGLHDGIRAGKSTADGSTIYGRNYDFPKILQPYQMARVEKATDGYKNINLSQYPMAGTHIGLNEKGYPSGTTTAGRGR